MNIKPMVPHRYSNSFSLLHWIIAILVISMLGLSFFLENLPKRSIPFGFMLHKSTGITILMLMLYRLIWVSYKGRLPLPDSVPQWEKKCSYFVQLSLYFFLILMPLTGWIMSMAANKVPTFFGLVALPLPGINPNKTVANFMNWAHYIIAWTLIGLVSMHILGALKHQFINKDEILLRMLPFYNKKPR